MKFEPDFALGLLRKLAESNELYTTFLKDSGPRSDGDLRAIAHHLLLLEDAGLVTRRFRMVPGHPSYGPDDYPEHNHGGHRLTFRGAEVVAMAENPGLWETAKDKAAASGGAGSLQTIIHYLFQMLKIVPVLWSMYRCSTDQAAE